MNARIELEIGALVLDGFPGIDGAAVRESVRHELARLIGEQGLPPSFVEKDHAAGLDGGRFTAAPGLRPDAMGAQIAQSIYQGMGS